MGNRDLVELLSSLSMAVINSLVSRDNGIGNSKAPDSIAEVNSLYAVRKNIVKENIDLVLKDRSYHLSERSFLNGLTDEDAANRKFGTIPVSIADVLETELLEVKNVIIPEVNALADKFNTLAESFISLENGGTLFNVEFFRYSGILKLLASTDLAGHETDDGLSLDGISYRFPAIEDFDTIRKGIKVGNPLVDESINTLLSSKDESYWKDLYNSVFLNVSGSNETLIKFVLEKVRYVDNLTFIYLVIKAISNGNIALVVEGGADEYKAAVNKFLYYIRQVLARTVNYISNTSDTLWEMDADKDTLIVRKENMGDLDIDTIIGSSILGIYKTEDVIANKEACKEQCVKAVDLSNIEKRNRLDGNARSIYLDIAIEHLTTPVDGNPEYVMFKGDTMPFTDARRALSSFVYTLSKDYILDAKKVFKEIILKYKYLDTNARFILDRMSFYLSSLDKPEDRYGEVAEYVSLELVSKYFVNTHIVFDSEE